MIAEREQERQFEEFPARRVVQELRELQQAAGEAADPARHRGSRTGADIRGQKCPEMSAFVRFCPPLTGAKAGGAWGCPVSPGKRQGRGRREWGAGNSEQQRRLTTEGTKGAEGLERTFDSPPRSL